MRKRKDFFARFGERLDIPREALPGGFGLSLSGQNELSVRGCHRILEYGDACIRLLLDKLSLRVEGEKLLCTVFVGDQLVIRGRITALRFEEVCREN
jgi:sporulation protein YqfC